MRNFDFEKLDLAIPPKELLTWDTNFDNSIVVDSDNPRTFTYQNGEQLTLPHGVYGRSAVSDQLADWVKTHIVYEYKNIGMSRNLPPCLGPHMDRTRFYTLQYMIDTGGDAVDTVFYEAASEQLDFDKNHLYMNDYRHLREISRFRARAGDWHLINGRTIHSVENISGMRVSLQIGLMRDPVENNLLLA